MPKPNHKLKVAIVSSGKRQLELAEQLGLHETLLSKFVNGWREPSDEQKKLIARALKAHVRDLFPEVAA